MKRSIAVARKAGPSTLQTVFASGFTAVTMVLLAGAAASVSLYLR